MFLASVPEVEYRDPWAISLAERLSRLLRGSQRAAYLYEQPDYSTFRYRVFNMIQALERSEVGAAFFTRLELDALAGVLERLDTLVICRVRYTPELNHLITRARSLGVRVLYDVDDMVFDVNHAHLIMATLDRDLGEPTVDTWFAEVSRMGAALKLCEGVIVTNEFLADRVRAFSHAPVAIVPNFLNRQQLEVSRRVYDAKVRSNFARTRALHLGYFSGTPSHNRDFAIGAGAIGRLLQRRKDVSLRVGGYMDDKALAGIDTTRVDRLPFTDFLNLQRKVGGVEVNLVPLQDNEFTNCKSNLKYFEAGIVGTITIASPVFTYRTSIEDGVNGFLARNVEWDSKLDEALAQVDDYRVMSERAFEASERCYAGVRHADTIVEVLFGKQSPSRAADPVAGHRNEASEAD